MTTTLDERTVRLIRQHAETSRLLGVGFVPVSASAPVLAPLPEPTTPARTTLPTRVAPGQVVEPKAAPKPATKPNAAPPAAPASRPRRAPSGAGPIEVPPGTLSAAQAQALLDEVRARYEAARPHEPYISTFTNIVFGEGDPCARLMFVGEAPGEQEDLTGRPFVGRSGELLEKMIVAMGLSRETVYIANVMKVRPPNNQTPTKEEAEASAPFLLDQIRVVQPEVIVTLGLPASRLLLGTSEPMRAMRGSFRSFPSGSDQDIFAASGGTTAWAGEPIPVMPTYHPAYLLRSYTPENRKKVWGDLQQVMDRLRAGKPG